MIFYLFFFNLLFNTTPKPANLKAKELVNKVSPANSQEREQCPPGTDPPGLPQRNSLTSSSTGCAQPALPH